MGRIGQAPITKKNGTEVKVLSERSRFGGQSLEVKGPKGTLNLEIRPAVQFVEKENEYVFELKTKRSSNLHGLYRTLLQNAIAGVNDPFVKELEIVGIGYKAQMKGKNLELELGLNHPIEFEIPEGISIEVKDGIDIRIEGIDKQLVGEVAAQIRRLKKPEPYKGKGIKYKGEIIKRKAGKAAATA